MPDHNIAISVRGVSKSYSILHESQRHTTAAEALIHSIKTIGKKQTSETFWALKDVSFDINKGDVVGIVGRNGAGKSTLLKILSRITEPTSGQIELYGRVGSLLEVGTGFHPELTGRENVFLNGAVLGMSRREIASHFDAIVDFAGVEKFLDTPVKRYSSGMYVRLAFAVAAHLEPEILIVDEVLAVGDAEFQSKCLGKMQDVAAHGRTVIFVSHNMAAVRQLCSSAILMKGGQVADSGDTGSIVSQYLHVGSDNRADICFDTPGKADAAVWFKRSWIINQDGTTSSVVEVNQSFSVGISVVVEQEVKQLEFTLLFYNSSGQCLFMCNMSDGMEKRLSLEPGVHMLAVHVPGHFLAPDEYSISLVAHEPMVDILDNREHALHFKVEETGSNVARYRERFGNILVRFPWEHHQGAALPVSAK